MKITQIIFVVFAIGGLIGVRALEDHLFYDPFLGYFHQSNINADFPNFEWGKLILNYVFRFLLNLVFAGVIIQSVFQNKEWTKQGIILISVVFLITLPIYLYCIYSHFSFGYLFAFYMRRFVIQPLIALLIIPLFYYRKQINSKKEDY